MHMPDKQPIRILSFDFDNCIYNVDYRSKIAAFAKPVMDLHSSIRKLLDNKAKETDLVNINSLEAQIKELKQGLKIAKAAFDKEEKYVIEANERLLKSLAPPQDPSFDKNDTEANQTLLSTSKERTYEKTIIMIGSNRQCKDADDYNSFIHGTQSCFHTITALQKYLKAELNKFLLADIVPEQSEKGSAIPEFEYGKSYEQALKDEEPHPIARWDATKIALIYAQMHQVAKQYPKDEIEYFFYDDTDSILRLLEKWYGSPEGAQWIPSNVTLHVIEYNGGDPVVRLKQGPSKFPFNSNFVQLTGEILDTLKLKEVREGLLPSDLPYPGRVHSVLTKIVLQNSKACTSEIISPSKIVPEMNASEKTLGETEISPFPQNTKLVPSFFSPNNALEKGTVEGSPNTGFMLN